MGPQWWPAEKICTLSSSMPQSLPAYHTQAGTFSLSTKRVHVALSLVVAPDGTTTRSGILGSIR